MVLSISMVRSRSEQREDRSRLYWKPITSTLNLLGRKVSQSHSVLWRGT